MNEEHVELLKSAFAAYTEHLRSPLEPADSYLSYQFPYVERAAWHNLADIMIVDELREITNQLHAWRDILVSWNAWNLTTPAYDEQSAWALRREFMEPLMHYCLIRPSSLRDTMTFVATNALHQIRLHREPGYKDILEGDPSPEVPKPAPLTRRKKESRLRSLAASVAGSGPFIESLRKLDDAAYRRATSDYRNRTSHAIGPRIGLGVTRSVIRKRVLIAQDVDQDNGTHRPQEASATYGTQYEFGGLQPLDPEAVRVLSLEQYKNGRICFDHFTTLLETQWRLLPRRED